MRDLITFDKLRDLVEALDKTCWSSWQTTAPFSKELDAAREYVREQLLKQQ